ncbi:unnamed protein product [Mytilus coruscus]|uniref:Reverse transcriptase domain-containing protein n=1 Tax=Mytilus coruscus TaxID=42192 RepID=A0A6J8EWI8_MYTCO|nr:unnamed protein product [Mytilus coruscus]
MYHKNNRSALQNTEFVIKSIEDLVQIGCVIKVPFQPYVVNPLSVATQRSDDGFGMSPDQNTCYEQSSFVKRSLIDAGFLINEEKSVFKPVTELEWLGIVWNSKEYKLSITQRPLNVILAKFPYVTARSLVQVVGRIISMNPVIGNVARIMSMFCYVEIESRIGWDIPITGYKPVEVLSELKFLLENVTMINYRKLSHYSKSSAVIYSEASNIAAGAYTVELENKIFQKMWTCSETVQSSTWRELNAIEFASVENRKVLRFNSLFWQPDSEAVDAFSQILTNENNWLVPPSNLVIRSIKHIIACQARGTLVVPKWTSAAFWPLIFDKHLIYQDYVKDVIVF